MVPRALAVAPAAHQPWQLIARSLSPVSIPYPALLSRAILCPGSVQARSKPVLWGLTSCPPTPRVTSILGRKFPDSGTTRKVLEDATQWASSMVNVGLPSAAPGSCKHCFFSLCSFPASQVSLLTRSLPSFYPLRAKDQGGLGCTQTQGSGILGRFCCCC